MSLHCSGPCFVRSHLSRLQMSGEYSFYMATGDSTYKWGTYVKQLLSLKDDNTLVRSLRSASTSEIGKKMSSNREPVLCELDKD
jgi:hypothetical protein